MFYLWNDGKIDIYVFIFKKIPIKIMIHEAGEMAQQYRVFAPQEWGPEFKS